MDDFINRVKNVITGKFSKTYMTRILAPILIINFTAWMAISWLLYPNYDWTSMDISQLGIPDQNPFGWIPWSIGLASTGLLQIPVISFMRRNITFNEKGIKMSTILLYLACVGSVALGIIPQFEEGPFWLLHIIHASMAFGGLYLGIWLLITLMLRTKGYRKNSIIPACFAFGAPIGFLITQGIRIALDLPRITPIWIINFSLWEWMLLYGIFGALISFIYLIPQNE